MAELPYLSTTVTDHLAQTAHLSAEAMGAYEVLRCHYWLRQGPLPTDDKQLARLARMTPMAWKKVAQEVLAFFQKTEAGYLNEGLEADLAKARHRSAKAKESIGHRWNKRTQNEGPNGIRTYHDGTTEKGTNGTRSKYSPSPSSPPPKGGGDGRDPLNPLVDNDVEKSVDNSLPVCKHCGTPSEQRPGKDAYCHNRECAVWRDDSLQQEFVKAEDFVPSEGVPV